MAGKSKRSKANGKKTIKNTSSTTSNDIIITDGTDHTDHTDHNHDDTTITTTRSSRTCTTDDIPTNHCAKNTDTTTIKQPTTTTTSTTTTTIITSYVNTSSTNQTKNENETIHLFDIVLYTFTILILFYSLLNAYKIRLHAIEEYGPVIHEFDPYFNYRATEVCIMFVFHVVIFFCFCENICLFSIMVLSLIYCLLVCSISSLSLSKKISILVLVQQRKSQILHLVRS